MPRNDPPSKMLDPFLSQEESAQSKMRRPGRAAPHLVLLGVDPGSEERGLPAVHILLGVTGQLNLPKVLVDIPTARGRGTFLTLPSGLASTGTVAWALGSDTQGLTPDPGTTEAPGWQ